MRYRRTFSTSVHGVGGPSTGLLGTFLGDAQGAAMVALGAAILLVGALLFFSSTATGQLVGQGAMGAARRGARFIPGVGALV